MIDTGIKCLQYVNELNQGRFKLICIPHAGSGASSYIGWQEQFGDTADILPVQLPGRENRLTEPLIESAETAAKMIADDLIPIISGEAFGIFGHSMGGIITFALALELEKRGIEPAFCAVSSTSIEEYEESTKSKYLSDELFISRIEEYEAVGKDSPVFEYPEFREVFMKILRADFNIVEDFESKGRTINAPVIAMCGSEDASETLDNMHSWENFTNGGVSFHEFSGNHFYLNDNIEGIVKLISNRISL